MEYWKTHPILEIIEQDSGKVFKIFADGKTEGFQFEYGYMTINSIAIYAMAYREHVNEKFNIPTPSPQIHQS